MEKREFLQKLSLGSLGLVSSNLLLNACKSDKKIEEVTQKTKNWIWITPNVDASVDDWKRKFAQMRSAGINAVVKEIYNGRKAYYASQHLPVETDLLEKILPLAEAEGLEVHAWMWSMPCLIEEIHQNHPEWFNVNALGQSSLEHPAYVDYYKFMCPSRPEVGDFVQKRVKELAAIEGLTGIHLDYIRHPDAILPVGLWEKYDLVQDKVYPEFDYCYCDHCRSEFKEKEGIDPMELENPSQHPAWMQYRWDSVTRLVNEKLVPPAKENGKMITAAVFPGPSRAREMVRQDWGNWHLDAFLPMLYHSFYNQNPAWIKQMTEEGVKTIHPRPLYSGLFIPELSQEEFASAIEMGLEGGAKGVSIFHEGAMTDAHWETLARVVKS